MNTVYDALYFVKIANITVTIYAVLPVGVIVILITIARGRAKKGGIKMINFLIWEILLPMALILTPLGIAALIEHYKEVKEDD